MVIGYKFITEARSCLTSEYFIRAIMRIGLSSVHKHCGNAGIWKNSLSNHQRTTGTVQIANNNHARTKQENRMVYDWPLLNIVCCISFCFRNFCDNKLFYLKFKCEWFFSVNFPFIRHAFKDNAPSPQLICMYLLYLCGNFLVMQKGDIWIVGDTIQVMIAVLFQKCKW